MRTRLLSHEQAANFYDRMGSAQDTQLFYEKNALRELVEHFDLSSCHAMIEFGCGTGHFAEELLEQQLAPQATYFGLDVSSTMVGLAKGRLGRYGARASIVQSDGSPQIDRNDQTFDRFVSNHVLDLLPEDEIRIVINEAHRLLEPDGLLGIVSLTNDHTLVPKMISSAWRGLHAISPHIVGGCRPIEILNYIPPSEWTIEYRTTSVSFGVPSEIIIARKR